MSILEELLEPLSHTHFVEHYLRKKPFAAPFRAEKFKGLLSIHLLHEILGTGHANCWLPKCGRFHPDNRLNTGRLSFTEALQGWEEGRTLLIRHAEQAHPILKRISNDFYNVFPAPIDIQVYYTPSGEEGFDWHYDVEEVFVIQSVGEKEFYLRSDANSKQVTACHLKAGDWLYIPSGYLHKAKALKASAHLSVGILM